MARDNRQDRHNWTPFADALDAWLYEESARRRSRMSRRKLAEALDLSYGAVDNWFTRGTLPEPEGFWALVRVTGWKPEQLAALCGYQELPPHVLGPWDFAREELERDRRFRAAEKQIIRQWLDEMALRYHNKPRRPGKYRLRRAEAAPTPISSSELTEQPPETPMRTGQEPIGAGK